MSEVYNSTTVEFQARRPGYTYSSFTKYGLPIVGGVAIGIGTIIFFTALLAPQEPPSWIPLILGIVLVTIGVGIVIVWKLWDRKGRGFMVLKPKIGEPIVQTQEEEFINQEGINNEILKDASPTSSMEEKQSAPSSKSDTPTPIPSPEIPVQSHYKGRHFASHGCGRRFPKMAPLARAEEITPSLRSSYSSLAYVQEFGSESSMSIDSTLFQDQQN